MAFYSCVVALGTSVHLQMVAIDTWWNHIDRNAEIPQ